MRGDDVQQEAMFSYLSPEARVPQDHPLRPIRKMVNQALAELDGEFQGMFAREGRPSIPPEKLLRALLLQVFQRLRKRVEEIFGWMKTVGNLRKTRHRGKARVGWMFTLTAAAYNLVRIRNLTAAVSP